MSAIASRCLAAGGLLAVFAVGAHAQQSFSISSHYTDFSAWQLFGSAIAVNSTPGNGFTYSDLILTQTGVGGQAGAGFAPQALLLDFNQPVHFDFNFFIPASDQLRGDGLTFTLAQAAGIGGAGSGLGYEGLGSSVAFAVDTFHFDGQPVSPSVQILQDGSVTPLAATETGLGDSIRDPSYQWGASVDWTPSGQDDNQGTLSGTITHFTLGSFTVQAQLDLSGLAGAPVVYGFTAGNGLATDGHIVTSAVPVPEPGSAGLLFAGLGLVGWRLRRRLASTR